MTGSKHFEHRNLFNRVDPVEYRFKSQAVSGVNEPKHGLNISRIEIYSTGLTKIENQSISKGNCLSFLK